MPLLVPLLSKHICDIQIKRNGIEVPLIPCHLPHEPPEPVRPVDQVQMADAHQRPLVRAPSRARHADQAIIGPLLRLHDPMRLPERRPQRRRRHRPVREVPHPVPVRRLGVELAHHVAARQLAEGARLHPQQLQRAVHARQVLGPDLLEDVVGEGGAPVRARDRGQAEDVHVGRLEPADHVAGVEAAHAVRDDVDALAVGLFLNVLAQFGGALFDGRGGGHRGEDHFDVVRLEGLGDAAPVVDAGEELADQVELVEAEEAVGEDDGVGGGSVFGADVGVVVRYGGAEVGDPGI